MKRDMRFSCIALALGALLFVCLTSTAYAAEIRLAGVRLNETVINLLTRNDWGQPIGIGPLAEISRMSSMGGASTVASPQGGMMNRGMMQGGGGGGAGMLSDGPMGKFSGGMMNSARPTTPAATGASQQGELRGTQGTQYWLYFKNIKPNVRIRVILGVEPTGNVSTITVQGPANTYASTSRGIHIGSSITAIQRAYGYPEQWRNLPEGTEITYPDQDVRFTVNNVSGLVTELTIGQPPVSVAPAGRTPAAATSPATMLPGGMGKPGMGRPGMGMGMPGGMMGKDE
jgi:hypothetical protein